jgi:hypothetical protein
LQGGKNLLNNLLKKGLVIGIIILFIGAVVVPSISGNNITKPETIIKPQLTREVLFSDDFNDNSKDYAKWTTVFNDGTWWERNQQTEFRLYETGGESDKEGIISTDIPVTLDDDPLVLECIMATLIDNYPDPYYQYIGSIRFMVIDSNDGTNYIQVVYYRVTNELQIFDCGGPEMTIGIIDDFRFKVTITIHIDRYMVEVGPYTSGWISKTIFSSECTMNVQLWLKLAGDFPYFWWIGGFDDVVVSKENGGSTNKPNRPSGPTSGKPGEEYTYTTYYTDPEGDQVHYKWDWADGTFSGWLGPFDSGETASATHSWSNKGIYSIRVKAKDDFEYESDWSEPLTVTMPRNREVQQMLFILQKLLFLIK